MKKLFNYSGDVTKPQAGAVIVWNGTKNNCGGEPAGHVAVIEEVKDNGNVIVSQSNWCSNCEKFSRNTKTNKKLWWKSPIYRIYIFTSTKIGGYYEKYI